MNGSDELHQHDREDKTSTMEDPNPTPIYSLSLKGCLGVLAVKQHSLTESVGRALTQLEHSGEYLTQVRDCLSRIQQLREVSIPNELARECAIAVASECLIVGHEREDELIATLTATIAPVLRKAAATV